VSKDISGIEFISEICKYHNLCRIKLVPWRLDYNHRTSKHTHTHTHTHGYIHTHTHTHTYIYAIHNTYFC
jgi:hypothetical protein